MSKWGIWVNLWISRIHLTRQQKNVGENCDDLASRRLIRTRSIGNLPAFFLKGTWVEMVTGAPWYFHWLNSQRRWAKDTLGFRWVTWAKYNSSMSLSFDRLALILFCHLLEKSKWETVGQFIITCLSIWSSNIEQWVQERARVHQAASGNDLPRNTTYSWVRYIIAFFPLWQVKLLFLLFVGEHLCY